MQPSFVERYRTVIVAAVVVAAVALVGAFVFTSASAAAFTCTTIWSPSPTPSPAAGASHAPGYVQPDMGRRHVEYGTNVTYQYCAPASGLALQQGRARARSSRDCTVRRTRSSRRAGSTTWSTARSSSCTPATSQGATAEGQLELKAFYDAFPNSPVCDIQKGTTQGPVIARFDQMATDYSAIVWGRVLPLETFDAAAILDFYETWGERTNPEPQCTPVESPSPSASPSASPRARARAVGQPQRRRQSQRLTVRQPELTARPVLALVKTAAGPGLSLQDVPMPVVGINDVLIKVHRTGICGTDLHIESWDAWAAATIVPPLIVGHEFVGEIVEIGSNVTDFAPGDLVSGEGHVVCGRCRHCLAGRRNLCHSTIGLGVGRDGAFAEYVVLPMTNIWHHWPGVDPEIAAIFDPFGNAVHTALAFPILGEDVLVSGAGPIGLMATAVVRHAGARHVVVSDPNPFRRDLAMRMGATVAVDPRERDLGDVAAELGMVEGFDVALEMSGVPGAIRAAVDAMAHGGGDRPPRHPDRGDHGGPQRHRLQDADPARDLRPGDVRDLVQDDRDAPVRARHRAGHHPPIRVPRLRGGLRGGPVGRVRQGHHGLDDMTDPLAFLDDELAQLARRSTCTGRCA